MIWLVSILTGLVAAIITIVAIVVATATVSMSAGEGSGGIGLVYVGVSGLLLFPAVLAFARSHFDGCFAGSNGHVRDLRDPRHLRHPSK